MSLFSEYLSGTNICSFSVLAEGTAVVENKFVVDGTVEEFIENMAAQTTYYLQYV